MSYLQNINNIENLFLTDIYEPGSNKLLIQVKGSVVADKETEVYATAGKSIWAKLISIDEEAPFYEIYFESYVSYHVLNEGFSGYDPDDESETTGFGKFHVFSKSGYMDQIRKSSIADQIFPGEMKHYGLFTENHIIHIIAFKEPEIEMCMPTA